jgi:hypothetical protein
MHAIDDEPDAISGGAFAIGGRDGVGHCADRKLHPRRGVHPRGSDDAGLRRELALEVADDLLDARARRLCVERDLTHLHAVSGRAQSQRLVRRVVIVLGRHHLFAWPHAKTGVHETEAHRRAVGEGKFLRLGSEEARGCRARRGVEIVLARHGEL